MAETNYTEKFKLALARAIEDYLVSKNIEKKLKVVTEYPVILSSGTKSKLDIAIINELDRGLPNYPNRVVAIETEIRSGQSYIELNYEKFKTFTEDKEHRVGSLIQLFTNKTNISSKKYQEIFEKSEQDAYEIEGFSYAMRHFEIYDERSYKQRATEVLADLKFKRILNKFIRDTHKVKYK
jgi:hypothetical protein